MTAERLRGAAMVLALVSACGGGSRSDGGGESSSSTGETDATTGTESSSSGDPDTSESGDPPPATSGDPPDPPVPCPDEWVCKADEDGDGKPIECDNAPDVANADQSDLDYDSFGDAIDLCPTVQQLSNEADSDRDGVGNTCDRCPQTVAFYQVTELGDRYEVRASPSQHDADRDGVGDACDNCPLVPNCLDYGDGPGLVPHAPGDPLDPEDPGCQPDADLDGIGDACEGEIGFGDADDFDGDGLANGVDLCPRVQVEGDGNHPDPDGDGWGTECDVCPFVADASQPDGDRDGIGDACEEDPVCGELPRPRAISFYDVAVGGWCCTTYYQGQALTDPDGNPLSPADLPASSPGLLVLPPGCEEALATAGVAEATRLGPDDVGGLDALWDHLCILPAWDQDLDAVPDACDLCPFAFDPSNAPYVDAEGREWPNDGAYCNGDYSCDP